MALYDPDEPKKPIDLLTEVILTSQRTTFCHFFMECGKRASKQIVFQGRQINVCDEHFEEIKKSNKSISDPEKINLEFTGFGKTK